MNPTLEQLQDYYDRLARHDWYYHYSDDGTVYRYWDTRAKELAAKAKLRVEYQELWEAWAAHIYKGAAKPVRPGTPPHTCKFCGSPSYLEPFDQEPPVDYCHPEDHGSPDNL